MYKENPKTKGSGIICAIPQTGECPMRCPDCFFQSGRSYLEPLVDNLPNMPSLEEAKHRIVRVNDGNDSNVDRELVLSSTAIYDDKFYNTSKPRPFDFPWVLTVNPGGMTDASFHKLDPIPPSLMFVRVRANTWNSGVTDDVVAYYTSRNVPVILTFMRYWKYEGSIPKGSVTNYKKKVHITNEYCLIGRRAWQSIVDRYPDNPLVYSCGKDYEEGKSGCKFCGNCVREYYNTLERLRGVENVVGKSIVKT